MKISQWILYTSFICVFLLLELVSIYSCDEVSSDDKVFFFTQPPGVFHTNDIEKAQKEVPFILVLPTYLPDEIVPKPYMIEGLRKDEVDVYDLPVSTDYHSREHGFFHVNIAQYNKEMTAYPSYDDSTYLAFNGTSVLEQKTEMLSFSSNGTEDIPGLQYSWNKNGTHFHVRIFISSRDEARKIIESMIQPID